MTDPSKGKGLVGNSDNLGRRRMQDTATFGAASGGLNIMAPVGGRANLSGGSETNVPATTPSNTTGTLILAAVGIAAVLLITMA